MKKQLGVKLFIGTEAFIAFLFRYFEAPGNTATYYSLATLFPVIFIFAHFILQKSNVSGKLYIPKKTPFPLFLTVFFGVYALFLGVSYIGL